ncbi:MAG TPA: cytochrome c oxidase assembly protein [Dehalococcoidia bacterium]|nr:cytochrome c oxidase assembly protein [Dehalococcoidia bacterium]
MYALHAAGSEITNWHLHPDAVILCIGLLACYWYAVEVWRPRIRDAGRVKQRQVIFFGLGVLVLYIGAGSPVHDISEEHLLSMHMVQHMLFALVAPPLLLAGIPTWLYEALLTRRRVLPVARVLLNPLVAILTVNMVLVITHLPHVVDYALYHHWFHFVVHVGIVSAALMMWWPIITNVPGLPALSYPYQMAYLFVQSLIPAVIGSFITFSRTAVYDFYEQAPRIWGLDPVSDQQLGAFIMKVVGSLFLWAFIGVAFFRWYAREEAESQGLPWVEVEEELREIGLEPNR